MRRSSVTTYNIDPRGHIPPQQLALEAFPPRRPGTGGRSGHCGSTFRWDNPIRQAQDGLTIMADASGGFAVTDTDDFTSGLKHIIEDIDHYYLLGFYPSDIRAARSTARSTCGSRITRNGRCASGKATSRAVRRRRRRTRTRSSRCRPA